MPGGVPPGRMGANGGQAARAVPVQQRGSRDQPALRLTRKRCNARCSGTNAYCSRCAARRGPRQERAHRRWWARQVRGVGSRTLRGIRADGPAEAALALREAVGARSLAVHVPVLVDEVAFLLRPRHGGWMIDGTVGMGGHAEAVLASSGADVRLLGLDTDPGALAQAGARLARFGERARLAHASFADLEAVAATEGVAEARAILLDLGVSSWQLDAAGRGFSFQRDEPLDMRLDPTRGATAAEMVNGLPERELARVLHEYGEER